MHLLPWHGMHLSIQTWIGIFTFVAHHSWVSQWLWVSIRMGTPVLAGVGLEDKAFRTMGSGCCVGG